jgi:hypothetical protein
MNYNDPQYKAYIKSDRWKIKCENYWLSKGRWCKACKSQQNLQVHHLSYANFMLEPLSDLVGLCGPCHRAVHSLHRRAGRREDIRTVTMRYINQKALDRLRRKMPRR